MPFIEMMKYGQLVIGDRIGVADDDGVTHAQHVTHIPQRGAFSMTILLETGKFIEKDPNDTVTVFLQPINNALYIIGERDKPKDWEIGKTMSADEVVEGRRAVSIRLAGEMRPRMMDIERILCRATPAALKALYRSRNGLQCVYCKRHSLKRELMPPPATSQTINSQTTYTVTCEYCGAVWQDTLILTQTTLLESPWHVNLPGDR